MTTSYDTLASLILATYNTDTFTYVSYENAYNSTFTVTLGNGKEVLIYRDGEGFYNLVMTAKQATNLMTKIIVALACQWSTIVASKKLSTMPTLSNLQVWQLQRLGLLDTWANKEQAMNVRYYTTKAKELMRELEASLD